MCVSLSFHYNTAVHRDATKTGSMVSNNLRCFLQELGKGIQNSRKLCQLLFSHFPVGTSIFRPSVTAETHQESMTAPVYHVKREQANYLVQKNASKKMRVKKTTSSRPSVVAAILVKNNARSRVTEASRRHYKSNHQAAVLIPTTLDTFFFSVCFNSQAVHGSFPSISLSTSNESCS